MRAVEKVWWVIPVWLALVASGFWWFEYRHWHNFHSMAITFEGKDIHSLYQQKGTKGEITVMHFVDQVCPCNVYSSAHIQRLQPHLAHATQITITPSTTNAIPATPSVAVWDKDGTLAYYGPYSSGAICGEGKDFVSRVLIELEEKRNPKWINTVGIGCYCPWQKNEVSYVRF